MDGDFGFRITASRFNAFADRITQHLTPEKQELVLRGIALKLLERLVTHGTGSGTPVDTGRARAGWSAAVVACGGAFLPAGNDWAMEAQGKKEGWFKSDKKGTGAFIQIFNGVPYIVHLEMGSSDQAPAGMVRINMEILRGEFSGAELAEVKKAIVEGNIAARAAALKWEGA